MTDITASALVIRLAVETLEDLHTGAGTGGGDIDALVQRDGRGHDGREQPVIRASHLKGVLREAGEELIAFGAATEDDLAALLGAPGRRRGSLRMTSLRVVSGGGTLVWGSTQRVAGGRAPAPDTLRFIEHVAAGTRFHAELRLANPALLPLLEHLLKRIDRIGGERNRGGGLVKLMWEITPTASLPSPPCDDGTVLRLVLRTLEPVCLPATGHPGNLIRSHTFMRGQTVRGALVAWAIHHGGATCLEVLERLSIGDALPLPEGCTRADQVVPIPLSMLTKKPTAGSSDIPWWAERTTGPAAFDSLVDAPPSQEKPKRPGAHEYLCRVTPEGAWLRYTPRLQVRLRNATPKRGSEGEATLFSLEEIVEDTCFQTDLRFDDAEGARAFRELFAPVLEAGDWLAIGRSGQPVVVHAMTMVQPLPPTTFHDDWTLTLISDAIVRGEHLGFLDTLDLAHLAGCAGVDPQPGWTIHKAVSESEPVHGFNAISGLPRAPALAVRRGSCWRIQGPGSAALAEALSRQAALGERCEEGFGRFLIDLQPLGDLQRPHGASSAPPVNRDEALRARARALASQIRASGPSLSQLQWLRERAASLDAPHQLDALLDELKTAPERRPIGGESWQHFPLQALRTALDSLDTLDEQRRLIVALVQWRVLTMKEARG